MAANKSGSFRPLDIVVLLDHLMFSGGRKLMLEYAHYLGERGHRVRVLTLGERGALSGMLDVQVVSAYTPDTIPRSDLILPLTPRLIPAAVGSGQGEVVFFCQGFQVVDLQQRVENRILPLRLKGKGLWHSLKLWRKRRKWKKKIELIDRWYSMPVHLLAVSAHLQEQLQSRYNRPVFLCRNGVHQEVFYPGPETPSREFTTRKPCRIACVGPADVTFKGIADTIRAIELVKSQGCPVEFVRVSPTSFLPFERENPAIDEFHESLSPNELGELLRGCDIYISNSLEGEGFGLPAMEALSCGLICILSDISSYRGFSAQRNFCRFVPQCNPEATAAAITDLIFAPASQRDAMRSSALRVASDFSFTNACQHFAEALEQIAEFEPQESLTGRAA